jgi:hypothetical protein
VVFDGANQCFLTKLDQIHYRAGLIVSGCAQEETSIIARQIVKDDWKEFWISELEVTLVMSRSTVLACEMAMIAHLSIIFCKFSFTDVTVSGSVKISQLLLCEVSHWFGMFELFVNSLDILFQT